MPTWSLFSRSSKPLSPAPLDPASQPELDLSDAELAQLNLADQTRRLRPVQFAPSRLATLYISRSERDLYLAAMSDLDNPPPPLPLWSEPAPALPSFAPADPLNARPPTWVNNYPASPKLVTSPDSGARGLLVRDEFRRIAPRLTQHALLTFSGASRMTFLNFPTPALLAAEEAIREMWPHGVRGATESVESLKKKPEGTREGLSWSIEVVGTVWTRKGHQELESIRLVLAVLTALGTNGWAMLDDLQAASTKNDSHNLLFAYSPDIAAVPPLFFALTLPVPDRISLISPPPRSTPALISAVRNAILAVNGTGHMRSTTGETGTTEASGVSGPSPVNNKPSKRILWGKKSGVKLEGWVHPGVYRFWMGGLRRFPGGRVRKDLVAAIHPPLLLNIVDTLSSLHFSLAASLPFLPLIKGRDVLIFQSLPSSGLSHRDGYVLDRQSLHPPTLMESPVLVSPELPDVDGQGHALAAPATAAIPDDAPATVADTRQLPWASMTSPTPAAQHIAMPLRQSTESDRRLLGSDRGASPKPRHVLTKKESLRRREAARLRQGSRQASDATRPDDDDGEWDMVPTGETVASAQVASQLGLPTPDLDDEPVRAPLAPQPYPPQAHQNLVGRRSEDTAESTYTDASAHLSHPLQLGGPMRASDPLEPVVRVPIQDSSAGRTLIDASHVESSYGSIGHFGGSALGRDSELGLSAADDGRATVPSPAGGYAQAQAPHEEHVVYPSTQERPVGDDAVDAGVPGDALAGMPLRLPALDLGEGQQGGGGVGSSRTRMVIS